MRARRHFKFFDFSRTFVLDTEKFRFIIYIWYEGGVLTPFLVPRGDSAGHRVSVPGGSHRDARER